MDPARAEFANAAGAVCGNDSGAIPFYHRCGFEIQPLGKLHAPWISLATLFFSFAAMADERASTWNAQLTRESVNQFLHDFEKTWQGSAKVLHERFYLTDVHVLSVDEASATATYAWNWEGSVGGHDFRIKGRGTRVLEQGQLQLVHEHRDPI